MKCICEVCKKYAMKYVWDVRYRNTVVCVKDMDLENASKKHAVVCIEEVR